MKAPVTAGPNYQDIADLSKTYYCPRARTGLFGAATGRMFPVHQNTRPMDVQTFDTVIELILLMKTTPFPSSSTIQTAFYWRKRTLSRYFALGT